MAVLQRADDEKPLRFANALRFTPPGKKALAVWRSFAGEFLQIDFPEERLLVVNGRLYLLPEAALETGKLHLIRYGLLLGEIRKGYFRPDHALALALKPEAAAHTANFAAKSDEIAAYWQRLDLPSAGPDGWLLVTVDGFALGWGKRVNGHFDKPNRVGQLSAGRVKNHYPRGLRQNRDWRLGIK